MRNLMVVSLWVLRVLLVALLLVDIVFAEEIFRHLIKGGLSDLKQWILHVAGGFDMVKTQEGFRIISPDPVTVYLQFTLTCMVLAALTWVAFRAKRFLHRRIKGTT